MTYVKKRPTIALCMIVKNERENLPKLFASVADCFDEIHITDTGSTDGTVEWLKEGNFPKISSTLEVHHFDWVDDFAAARNASFAPAKTDYIMWLDGDDVLGNPAAFKLWRDTAMELADFWLAPYHYAFADGRPVCSFTRERVVKRERGFKWLYFIHEGIDIRSGWGKPVANQINTWCVNHMRTADDIQKDRSRNIRIFEKNAAGGAGKNFPPRMHYYWGKELFENNQMIEAFNKLGEASVMELELHDRILCIQYLTQAAQMLNQWEKSISIALQGVQLSPLRPEFHVLIGDAMLKGNRIPDAIPFYTTARECAFATQTGASPLFSNPAATESYPTLQLAKIWIQMGDFKKAKAYAQECVDKWPSGEAKDVLAQINEVLSVGENVVAPLKRKETGDIVITCPPVGAYPWDEEIYGKQGIGGSETAAVEMSRHLAKLTGRKVIIFNNTQAVRKFPSGVEYRPANHAPEYFRNNLPAVNIQWRHTVRMTPAPSMVWCHDLLTPGLENMDYDKAICLSEFSKRYTMTMQGVRDDKIHVSRNGINPDRFRGWKVIKDPNKVVFPSSPDRGLDRAMRIMDKARELTGLPLELHVYYGLDNLEKFGMGEMAKNLKAMMAERPWVKYHGNVKQDLLAKELHEAAVWLYPANFIETFCITAIECLASGCFPLVREMGALQNTLRDAHLKGMARLLNVNAETELEQEEWAANLAEVIREKAWENVKIDLDSYSWESVAREWCKWLNLSIQS